MTNILDISRSGILAYRTALAVTAENIANVGTDGYRRRDVSTVAAAGGQSTATTQPTGGQGVSVADIRRAFDDLAAERARSASGAEAASSAHLAGARAIETLMIPGDDGIDGVLRNFFDAASRFADNPTDFVTRSVMLGAGQAAAGAISELAQGMSGLRSDLTSEAARASSNAQGLLQDLADVSKKMGGQSAPNSSAASAMHPLADRRDAILGELASLLPISVTLEADGRPTVRFGSSAGPLLLEGVRTAKLSVSAADQLTLHIETADGAMRETRSLNSGRIGGLSRAMGALDMANAELDAFARTLSESMNRIHQGGVDQLGRPGGYLFATDGWQVRPAPANGGTVQVSVTPSMGGTREAIELIFDGVAGLWRAHDGDGKEIASGKDRLVLPGVEIDLAGRSGHGDRISIVPTSGRAIDLRLAITDPARLAAASAFAATASPANRGSAELSAVMTGAPVSELPQIGFGPQGEAIYLSAGAIGVIPAGSGPVSLSSLGRSASTTLVPVSGATRLTLTLDAGSDGFDLNGLADASAIAAALNSGSPRSDTGKSLGALGLVASVGSEGALVLSRPGAANPAGATLSGPGATVTGVEHLAEPAGGTIQVITRNGRHVAGTPLSPSEIETLLTPENGFLAGAVYDASPLTATSPTGYRGITIERLDVPGLQGVVLTGSAVVSPSAQPFAASDPRNLVLSDASGARVSVDIPSGASAALIASRLDAALPGVAASASTAVELSGFRSGLLSFALMGANGSALQVSATLLTADATPLAQAINALSGATGVRAELSPDGARMLLVQPQGHDITLSGLGPVAAGGLTVTPAHANGMSAGQGTLWVPGQSVRLSGEIALAAAQGFTLSEGLETTSSAPQSNSTVTAQSTAAGAVTSLTFRDIPTSAEGGLLHTISLSGRRFEAAIPVGTSAAGVASALATALRTGAPDAVLTGQPLAVRPQNGSAMSVQVDGGLYSVRIQDGEPVVSGPESGRVTARFDEANRLVIAASGITDGKGIVLSPSPGFGFASGAGQLTLTGHAPDISQLPATLAVRLQGETYDFTLGPDNALEIPAGFPGAASRDPVSGALRLTVPAPAEGFAIAPVPAAGFGGPGVAVRVEADRLVLTGDGPPLGVQASIRSSLGQSLTLTKLPPEDLVVAMTGSGLLRLAGSIDPAGESGTKSQHPGDLTLEIVDAATGRVALNDAVTGHRIAEGILDSGGRASLAGLTLQLRGTPATGDRFGILPARAGSANADIALSLAALRNPDATTGSPGLTDRLNRIQGDTGLRAAAAARSHTTARAAAEASEREQAAIGAVDLDTEAARLLELQQAYQASAQAAVVARSLFDTLIKLF